MAIYGFEGKPGSGKSYAVVSHLVRKYFEWDKTLMEFFPKSFISIVSNIDELKLNHYSLDDMILKAGGAKSFWNVDYQKRIMKDLGRIVYIIDEAGAPDKFPRGLKDESILFLFQYHRHLGLDFYLISTHMENVSPGIVRLMEFVNRAQSRSKGLTGRFRYDRYIEGDRVGIMFLKKDKRIFGLYRSMSQSETEGVPNAYRQFGIMFVVLVLLCICGAWYFFSGFGRKGAAVAAPASSKSEVVSHKGVPPVVDKVVDVPKIAEPPVAKKGVSPVDGSGDRLEKIWVTPRVDGILVAYTNSGLISDFESVRDRVVKRGDSLYLKVGDPAGVGLTEVPADGVRRGPTPPKKKNCVSCGPSKRRLSSVDDPSKRIKSF